MKFALAVLFMAAILALMLTVVSCDPGMASEPSPGVGVEIDIDAPKKHKKPAKVKR